MRVVIFIIVILFSSTVFAQECRLEIDEFDDFTKERTTLTKSERWAANVNGEVYIKAQYKNKIYSFLVEQAMQKKYSIKEGDEIIILFEDESMLRMAAAEPATAAPNERTGVYRQFVNYDVAEEVWETLKNKKIKKIRIAASGSNFDYEVLAQKADLLSKLISCVEKD